MVRVTKSKKVWRKRRQVEKERNEGKRGHKRRGRI